MSVRNAAMIISILLPILGGVVLIEWKTISERMRRIFCEVVICAASVLIWSVILGGTVDEFMIYSFARGFQVTLRMDGMSMLFAGMISIMWPFVTLYAFEYMEHARHKNSFFGFYIMTYGVTLGVACSGNLLTLYVFFEMLSLVTIPLVSHYQDHESMYAGRVYAEYVIGGAAMAFITVVVLTMYTDGGFSWGGHLYASIPHNIALLLWLLGFFGFGVKAAIMPFHLWLPEASVAPTPVTALLHAVAVVNSGVFAVIRLSWYEFGPGLLLGTWAQHIAIMAASFTLLYASIRALRERHFKKRLAYSTISNLSYMLYGVTLMIPEGLHAGLAHMLFHGVIKMSLFLCAGAFIHKSGKYYLNDINGAGRKMPWTFGMYSLGALSLTGVPLLAGFISKWNLLMAGAGAATIWSYIGTGCLIGAAFFCAIYTLSISIRAFFPMDGSDVWAVSDLTDPGWRMLVPITIFSVADILFGVFPMPIMDFLGRIAGGLM